MVCAKLAFKRFLGAVRMAIDKAGVEEFLHVGVQTFIDVATERGHPKRAKSRFRGWVPGEYILMDLPALPDEAAAILKDATCVLRFVHDGAACGFDSKILDWCDMGLPFFRVAWPKDVEVLHVRKHARIPVQLPCTIGYAGGEEHAEVRDLSIGGCGLFSKRFFKEGTPMQLSFTLPDGVPLSGIRAQVCRTRPQGNGVFVGCHFLEESSGPQDALIFFMSSTLSRMGIQPMAERRVLVVHPESSDRNALIQAFERAGVQAIAAHNAVDAFYRLRMAPPGCLLLDIQQPIFAVSDLCAAIRQTPGFEAVPLFLMGESADGTGLATQCGAIEWFSQERVQGEPDMVVAACLRAAARSV